MTYLEVEFLDDKYLEVAQEMAACFLPGRDSSTLAMVACKMSVGIVHQSMFSCSSMLPDLVVQIQICQITFPRSSSFGSFPLIIVGELGANLVYLLNNKTQEK